MVKSLTPELVIQRTKAERLENVRNLNLWGNELEDVRVLRELPNIEILSLSVNKIRSLKDFGYCPKLSELYLRKNLISDLTEIRHLQNLPNLRVLWLWDNPCTEQPNYRQYITANLPNLVKLDNQLITSEEKNSVPQETVSAPKKLNTKPPVRKSREEGSRGENILCAVLALLKELDESGLELVKRDVERKLRGS